MKFDHWLHVTLTAPIATAVATYMPCLTLLRFPAEATAASSFALTTRTTTSYQSSPACFSFDIPVQALDSFA